MLYEVITVLRAENLRQIVRADRQRAAAARTAYRLNEVVAIYPITPSSPLGERSDASAAVNEMNLCGMIPKAEEMEGEEEVQHGADEKRNREEQRRAPQEPAAAPPASDPWAP